MNDPRIIIALDFPDAKQALDLTAKLDPASCRVKVGKELFTAAGPQLVEKLMDNGFEVFLDLKFHDIPSTVAGACKAAAGLGVWMMNIHALGGRKMLIGSPGSRAGGKNQAHRRHPPHQHGAGGYERDWPERQTLRMWSSD